MLYKNGNVNKLLLLLLLLFAINEKGEGVVFWIGVTIFLAGIVARQLDVIADRSRD